MMGRLSRAMLISVLLPFSAYANNTSPEISGVIIMYDLDAVLIEGSNLASLKPLHVRFDALGSELDYGPDCTLVDDTNISCDFFPNKLPPAGEYQLEVSNGLSAGLSEDGQSITYELIIGPECAMETDQVSYTDGETLNITSFAIANPTSEPAEVEWKGFLEVPLFDPIGFINVGADGSYVLPIGFAFDFGPFPLFVVEAGFPAGTYTLGCRLLNPVTGALLYEDLYSFEIVH